MAVTYNTDAKVTINGLTGSGPGITLLAEPSFLVNSVSADDYFAKLFQVNATTTTTAIDLGKVVTGKILWIQTDQEITVTLTQSATDNDIVVKDLLLIRTEFTEVKVANAGAAVANISLVVAGDRITNPGTPGVF